MPKITPVRKVTTKRASGKNKQLAKIVRVSARPNSFLFDMEQLLSFYEDNGRYGKDGFKNYDKEANISATIIQVMFYADLYNKWESRPGFNDNIFLSRRMFGSVFASDRKMSAFVKHVTLSYPELSDYVYAKSISKARKFIYSAFNENSKKPVVFMYTKLPNHLDDSLGSHSRIGVLPRKNKLVYFEPKSITLGVGQHSSFMTKLKSSKYLSCSPELERTFGTQRFTWDYFIGCMQFVASLLDGKSLEEYEWKTNRDCGLYLNGTKITSV